MCNERVKLNDLQVNISRDVIDVTSFKEPDPDWIYTDSNGHEHRWKIEDDWNASIPTCIEESILDGYYEDGEPDYRREYRCKLCGEVIHPEMCPVTYRRYKPLTSANINGVPVTLQEAQIASRVIMAMEENGVR